MKQYGIINGNPPQHASEIYIKRFGLKGHSNEDISKVDIKNIPDYDLLVGGFPCQDYSVARTLSYAKGLQGNKGVLWWEIYRILDKKIKKPQFLLLENVDRLLKSPASLRGRDFSIMLASLAKLGYAVEWRVINAADYGKPQRRKRVFILGYRKGSEIEKEMRRFLKEPQQWILKDGVLVNKLKVHNRIEEERRYDVGIDPVRISNNFFDSFPSGMNFFNSGLMIDGKIYTAKTKAKYNGKITNLGDILESEEDVPREYYISPKDIRKWEYLKGAKSEERKLKSGFVYKYSEGKMAFPDFLDQPSRTIITAEGGTSPSRFKHVIKTKTGKYRRLTPLELERLCQFPDNHTKLEGIADGKRAFLMGNALVVGIIEDIANSLLSHISSVTKSKTII